MNCPNDFFVEIFDVKEILFCIPYCIPAKPSTLQSFISRKQS